MFKNGSGGLNFPAGCYQVRWLSCWPATCGRPLMAPSPLLTNFEVRGPQLFYLGGCLSSYTWDHGQQKAVQGWWLGKSWYLTGAAGLKKLAGECTRDYLCAGGRGDLAGCVMCLD